MPHTKAGFDKVERHNERKNDVYSNPDVIPERSHMNVHFKECGSTYAQVFDKLTEDKVISTRGLKKEAKVFAEMVFDVNTAYFERKGGYEYAKQFYAEAYKMAVQEIGGEQYVLSAVMHADERNKSLSADLGKDVYHYHLHVVYVPVVDKEIRWSKRCKDKALRGQIKEVVKQVSHSKKWASPKTTDKDGNTVLVPSYSLLQDRFFEHMATAGFEGFERGKRGSTAEHLSVLDYKIEQNLHKLAGLEKKAQQQERKLLALAQTTQTVQASFHELDSIGKPKAFGKVELQRSEFDDVINLAKEGIMSRSKIAGLERDINDLGRQYDKLKQRFDDLWWETKEYREAFKLAPDLVKALFQKIREEHKAKRQERRQRCSPDRGQER